MKHPARPKAMTVTILRIPQTLRLGDGSSVNVEELSVQLPIVRDLAYLGDVSEVSCRATTTIYITHTVKLSCEEFNEFCSNLRKPRDWLRGHGGRVNDGDLCVEVCSTGNLYLYVNPQGSDYARYLAQLG
jgi:hypothetical protein